MELPISGDPSFNYVELRYQHSVAIGPAIIMYLTLILYTLVAHHAIKI